MAKKTAIKPTQNVKSQTFLPEQELADLLQSAGSEVIESTENLADLDPSFSSKGVSAKIAAPQQRFIELAKQKEAIVEELIKTSEALEAVMRELGLNKFVQDSATQLVYKVIVPSGRYVMFPTIDYVRTKTLEEDRGDLSFTAAEEAGFNVDALKKKKTK